MIKLDIINRLADQTGIPKLKAEQAVDALFHSMKDALSRGDRIELRGFGVFIVKPRKRRVKQFVSSLVRNCKRTRMAKKQTPNRTLRLEFTLRLLTS